MDYLTALIKIREGAETNTTVALSHDEARAVLERLESFGAVPTFAPPTTPGSIKRDQDAQERRDRALPARRKRYGAIDTKLMDIWDTAHTLTIVTRDLHHSSQVHGLLRRIENAAQEARNLAKEALDK